MAYLKLIEPPRNGNRAVSEKINHARLALHLTIITVQSGVSMPQPQHAPLKSNIAVLLDGNHEYNLVKYYPYVRGLCKSLSIPYGTYTSIISFYSQGNKKKKLLFKMFATHGNGTIDHRYYLNTASFSKLFRRGISGYAERANHPMEQGFCVVKVRDGVIVDAVKECV